MEFSQLMHGKAFLRNEKGEVVFTMKRKEGYGSVYYIFEKNLEAMSEEMKKDLPEAFEVMKEWGYKYKTMITWRKIMSLGMGFWFRGQTEHLLLGVRGKVKAFRIQKANFIQCKAEKHSQKPKEFRDLIEMTKLTPKIELFARQKTKGWDVWGNEVESDIELWQSRN
ncbi:hypothetical protein LCGC14_2782570, partial [marine sediment metagenome]